MKKTGRPESLFTRLPVLLAFLFVVGVLGYSFQRDHDLPSAWQTLRIPSLSPTFADTRTITHSIDCVLSGCDPYIDRSFDPWHRLYNYPPIWLELRHVGVRSTTTNWMGAFLACSFGFACFALFRVRNWFTACIVFLALISWPVLFALERGNTDLLIFALLVVGGLRIGEHGERFPVAKRGLLIACMTVLKIYPIFAVLTIVRRRQDLWKACVAAVVAIVALFATGGAEVLRAIRNTPQMLFFSFGSATTAMSLQNFAAHHGLPVPRVHPHVIAVVLAAAGICIALFAGDALERAVPRIDLSTGRGFVAAAGLTIYVCVSFSGASFDYRLIFLLCPLMYLVEDLNKVPRRGPAVVAILLVMFLWSPWSGSGLRTDYLDPLFSTGACAWITDTMLGALGLRNKRGQRGVENCPSIQSA